MSSKSDKNEGPFRKKSLERIASPEQLDKLMTVIGAKGWLAFWCIVFLIACALVWAFFGNIPVQVKGMGIILTEKGLFSVQSSIGGIVLDVYVNAGDWIKKDTLIAKLNDQALTAELRKAQRRKQALEDILKKMKTDNIEHPVVQPVAVALRKQLEEAIERIDELERKNLGLDIFSSVDGQILELSITPGDIIQPGQLVAWLNLPLEPGETYLCYAYLPVADGEKVKVGMGAEIKLANVDAEVYGYLLGSIEHVSTFAISDHEMIQRIRNPQLVQYLKQGNSTVTSAIIKPYANLKTISGYQWSSAEGPPYQIRPGTTANVNITLEIRRPISYLFPFLNAPNSQKPTDQEPEVDRST